MSWWRRLWTFLSGRPRAVALQEPESVPLAGTTSAVTGQTTPSEAADWPAFEDAADPWAVVQPVPDVPATPAPTLTEPAQAGPEAGPVSPESSLLPPAEPDTPAAETVLTSQLPERPVPGQGDRIPLVQAQPMEAPDLRVHLPQGPHRTFPPVVQREPRWSPAAPAAIPAGLAREMAGAMGDRYEGFLDAVGHEPVYAQWPAAGENGAVQHTELPARFIHRTATTQERRTLSDPPADVLDRLELVRLIAVGLDARHQAGIMSAGLSLDSIVWTDRPTTSVGFVDHDRLRHMGGEFLGPTSQDPEPDSFDRDRRDYARLVAHLLTPVIHADPWEAPRWIGLTEATSRQVARLLQRSEGHPGTRPMMSTWREVWGV